MAAATGIGDHDEFDAQVPHWFGAAGKPPVEIVSILSGQGERIHVRAAPARKRSNG
jgi:hypothetical protein